MKRKHEIRCNYCGSPAILKPASEIFNDPKQKGYVYVCSHYPACDAYVSVHPGTKTPMGSLANAALRKKRILAHQAFDQIWKRQIMSRKQAYYWLSDKLGTDPAHTHIAQFGDYRCEQVIRESRKVLINNRQTVSAA